MEKVDVGESWNKKRIIAVILLVMVSIIGGYFFKTRVLGENLFQQLKSVKGIGVEESATQPAFRLNIQEAIKEKINNIKQEVTGLDVMEIASSSPQVQKILRDIKSLEQYPVNQARDMCKKICESF